MPPTEIKTSTTETETENSDFRSSPIASRVVFLWKPNGSNTRVRATKRQINEGCVVLGKLMEDPRTLRGEDKARQLTAKAPEKWMVGRPFFLGGGIWAYFQEHFAVSFRKGSIYLDVRYIPLPELQISRHQDDMR